MQKKEILPVVAVHDEPKSWYIEGELPNSCKVIIRVTFLDTVFSVEIKSNASYEVNLSEVREKYYNYKDDVRKEPINTEQKMRSERVVSTKDLSESALIDALIDAPAIVSAIAVTCTKTIVTKYNCPPRDCDCYRNTAHPFGLYGMPSLWDSPNIEIPLEVSQIEVGKPSNYLRTIKSGEAVIVYNSLLGNLRYANPEIADFFCLAEKGRPFEELKLRFPDVDLEAEVKTLRQLGFLVVGGEDVQLHEKINQRESSINNGEMVRCLRLNTASGCNLACTYCHGVNEAELDNAKLMSLETAIKSIHVYTDVLLANHQKLMNVRYFGGEPLLNWPVVRDSLKYAADVANEHQLSLTVLLNTNATLLTSELIEELAGYKQILTAIVSLDGPLAAHDAARIHVGGLGSFEQTCQGLDMLLEADIPVSISVTMGAHNQNQLCGLIDLLLERDIHAMGIDPVRIVFEQSDPLSLADALIKAIEYGQERGFHVGGMWEGVCERLEYGVTGSYCGGSGSELSVLPSGEIFPCQSQPMRLGTLQDVETRELFASDVYHRVTMRVVGNLPDCRGCEIEGMCVGGCAADAYASEHDLYGRTRYCEFLKKMVRYHLGKLGEMVRVDRQES